MPVGPGGDSKPPKKGETKERGRRRTPKARAGGAAATAPRPEGATCTTTTTTSRRGEDGRAGRGEPSGPRKRKRKTERGPRLDQSQAPKHPGTQEASTGAYPRAGAPHLGRFRPRSGPSGTRGRLVPSPPPKAKPAAIRSSTSLLKPSRASRAETQACCGPDWSTGS